MEDDSNSLGWFFAGAIIGAGVGMLFAPKSGTDTREYISKSAKDSADAMEASGKELMERGKELYERGRQIAEDASDLFERGKKLVHG